MTDESGSTSPELDLARLRQLAQAAIAGDPMDRQWPTEWEAWFNFHGDPFVVEKGRKQWAVVATVATAPADYGQARANYIGACGPATMLALLDMVESHAAPGDDTAADLSGVSTEQLWAELERRGAALHVGYCYPAAASEPEATDLIHQHGYEYGPWQFIELGERLAAPPQWRLLTDVPPKYRRERNHNGDSSEHA